MFYLTFFSPPQAYGTNPLHISLSIFVISNILSVYKFREISVSQQIAAVYPVSSSPVSKKIAARKVSS